MIFSRNPEVLGKFIWVLAGASAIGWGCARVEVQAPKDPIKMDISMRLDVYQHVVKDIDAIENIVAGGAPMQHAFASFLIETAYAEDLDPAVEAAAIRRRDRRAQVQAFLAQGALGEDNRGLLSIRNSADPAAASASQAENSDREAIYQALASKNSTSVDEVRKVYAEKLRKQAPAGAPVQSPDGVWEVSPA